MARVIAVLALATGCRASETGGSRIVVVTAFAGDRAEPGATVIGHAGDGTVIDRTTADAVGIAEVGVDDGAFVTVVFPGTIGSLTPVISAVTVPAPDAEVTVYGPPRPSAPPLTVGVLRVTGPALPGAEYFEIRLGCVTVRASQLPASLDVEACSLGSDARLDVLVTGHHDVGGDPPAPVLDGYAAGRVTMQNGLATLDIEAWHTTTTTIPLALDGVAPVIDMVVFSDGLSFGSVPVTDHGALWTGLAVDATRITAALAGSGTAQITTREITGAPVAIELAAADFLPPIAVTATLAGTAPPAVSWQPTALGDAVNLRATWQAGGHRVVWDAVLPPDASAATLPALDGELGAALSPARIEPVDVVLRYVDSAAHDGFAALLAAGIHAEETLQASTIAPRPANGDIRTSHAIGLH